MIASSFFFLSVMEARVYQLFHYYCICEYKPNSLNSAQEETAAQY